MVQDRVSLSVYLQSLKQVKQLKRYGHVHYVSRKMKYVVLYTDVENMEQLEDKLQKLPFVKRVRRSMRPWIKTEYQKEVKEKIPKDDYKMGL
ncbi:YlbG family protein [Alkalicoccus urumqiensis]|uniref:UPF0298 protein C6I21_12605 n=1 Tax=Alkalicoccus urumqiensis TaxID=1548213 RepID=A0A2P6MEN2_ALKUR|nr:YlbG family protein [Alkalicoccus urumqiensis]PRO64746.1 hypothetical protein C6I21_12605 [Alkalicoccus urumqiensis]